MSGKSPARRSLGRGLDALLGTAELAEEAPAPAAAPGAAGRPSNAVPVSHIHPGKFQPRRHFAEEDLATLAQSIRDKGVLQPILLRPLPGQAGQYELVAGERRWRAAQLAGLHEIPALVRDLADGETLEIALVENLQRADLSPLEESRGYQRMIDEFGHTQENVATVIAKSRSHVANMLRLLTLPAPVQAMLERGQLSAGQARPLIGLDAAESLANHIVSANLSARDAERLAATYRAGGWDAVHGKRAGDGAARGAGRGEDTRSADIVALERDLSTATGMAIQLKSKGEAGELVIRYKTLEQLDDLIARLRGDE